MFSPEIYLNTRNRAEEISLPAVDKQMAQEVINLIQKIIQGELPNQNRIERNRQRLPSHGIHAKESETNEDHYAKLDKLADLKQKGALSEEELQLLNALLPNSMYLAGIVSINYL